MLFSAASNVNILKMILANTFLYFLTYKNINIFYVTSAIFSSKKIQHFYFGIILNINCVFSFQAPETVASIN